MVMLRKNPGPDRFTLSLPDGFVLTSTDPDRTPEPEVSLLRPNVQVIAVKLVVASQAHRLAGIPFN